MTDLPLAAEARRQQRVVADALIKEAQCPTPTS